MRAGDNKVFRPNRNSEVFLAFVLGVGWPVLVVAFPPMLFVAIAVDVVVVVAAASH